MRFTQKLNQQRAAASNLKILKQYFSIFKKVIKDYKLQIEYIQNIDKKSFLIELASKAKVICRQRRKNPRYTCNSSKKLIIVLKYVSTREYL